MRIYHLIKYSRYVLTTVCLNLKLKCKLSAKAPFFPIIATSKIRLYRERNAIIEYDAGSYIRLGYSGSGIAAFEYTGVNLELHDSAILRLHGTSLIGYGCSLCVYPNAVLEIGSGTYLAANSVIKCLKRVCIGSDCAISWNVTILDSDFHPWSIHGKEREISNDVVIEDHVWIGNGAMILKGVTIGTGSIIAAGSIVTKDIPPHCLAVGNPARIIHDGVSWR
jgi:acetyltransferase-like isoleucine patch superfamily enzyme